MYWAAPELLRDANVSNRGTPKGDVYSFAVILLELLYCVSPYQDEQMLPRGKLLSDRSWARARASTRLVWKTRGCVHGGRLRLVCRTRVCAGEDRKKHV